MLMVILNSQATVTIQVSPSGSFPPTSLLGHNHQHRTHTLIKISEKHGTIQKYTQGFQHPSLLPSVALTETSKISPRAKDSANLYAQARLEAGRPLTHLQPGQDYASTQDHLCCKSSPPWAGRACPCTPGVQGKQHCSVSASFPFGTKGQESSDGILDPLEN